MSIRHIAKKTGVSVATVSRVLNNSGLVNPDTRKKVLDTLEKVNFKSKRSKRKTTTIGIAIPDMKPGRLNYIYIREFMGGVMETAARYDTAVKIIDLNEIVHVPEKPGCYSDFCRDKGVSALIHIQSPISFHHYIEKLADDGIPQVVIEHKFERPDIGWITLDNVGASRNLAEHLVSMKLTEFAIVSASHQFQGHYDRHAGYVSVLEKHGFTIPPKWDIERQMVSIEAGSSAVLGMLSGSQKLPQVIYFTNVELALGGIQALVMQGARLPQDVIVAMFDDSQFSQWITHPVLYISQPAFTIGAQSADYLLTHKPGVKLQQTIIPDLFFSPKIIEIMYTPD